MREIRLYSWMRRELRVVEIHNPRLFEYLRERDIRLRECAWYDAPGTDFLRQQPRGLVSVSRTHWQVQGAMRSLEAWTAWLREGAPGIRDPAQPDPERIAFITRACELVGHVPFSRDQLLRTDGAFGDWEQLREEVDQFLALP